MSVKQGQGAIVETFKNMHDFEGYFVERDRVTGMEAVRVPLGRLSPDWIISCTQEGVGEPLSLDKRRHIDRVMQMGGDHATIVGLAGSLHPKMVTQPESKAVFDGLRGDHLALIFNEETSLVLVRIDTTIGNPRVVVDEMHIVRATVSVPLRFSAAEIETHHIATAKSPFNTPSRESYKTPPLIDLFERSVVEWHDMPQDPRFFNEKIDKVGLVTVRNNEELELDFRLLGDRARDYAWVSPELLEDIVESGYANVLLCTARVEVIKHLAEVRRSTEHRIDLQLRQEASP